MEAQALLAKKIDVSKIRYGPLKKNPVGGKSVYINYGGEKLVLQFPLMHVPYAVSDGLLMKEGKKDEAKAPSYSMNVSFKGKEDNKAIGNLFTKLQEIEDKIKKDVFTNRVTWLNDRYDDMEVVVSKLFSSNISYDKDKETKQVLNRYPPTFRVKLPSIVEKDDDGNSEVVFKFDATDMENNEVNFAELLTKLKGSKAQLIVQLAGLWFAGGKYGCTWKVLSGRFQVARNLRYNYVEDSDDEAPVKGAVRDEEEEDEDVLEDVEAALQDDPPSPPRKATKAAPVSKKEVVVPESEEEEEEVEAEEEGEEEEEEEPTPPPPPPKKVIKKVTAKK